MASILGSVCQTIVPLVERQIVDGVIVRDTSPLWIWLVLLVGLSAAGFVFAYVRRYRGGKMALGVQYDLRCAMHDHLLAMDFDNLNRMPTGQLVARANSDSALVQGLLAFFPIVSGNILLLLLSLAVMLYLSPLARPRQLGGGPRGSDRLVPDAMAGVPGHLGRPATRGRRGPDRRRGGQRRPGREGVRAGAPRSWIGWSSRPNGCTGPRCGPCGSRPATNPSSRPYPPSARSPSWPSAATWPWSTRSPSGRFSPSRPTWPRWWRPPACWPGCSPSPSRPAPASSASSSSSTCRRPSPIALTRSTPARLAGAVDFDGVTFAYPDGPPVLGTSTCIWRRGSGSRWSGRAGAESRRWP